MNEWRSRCRVHYIVRSVAQLETGTGTPAPKLARYYLSQVNTRADVRWEKRARMRHLKSLASLQQVYLSTDLRTSLQVIN